MGELNDSEFTAGLRESCGVFGCILADGVTSSMIDTPRLTVNALSALQHRGNESSGMVGQLPNDDHIRIHKGMGQVREVYTEEALRKFDGSIACIGHNRYSTAGLKDAINCIQPFVIHTLAGKLALAHNGELVNAHETRKQVLRQGVGLSTDSDSEVIAQILARSIAEHASTNYEEMGIGKELLNMMSELTLSYALCVMIQDRLYAIRDPWGNRPLSIGTIQAPAVNGHKSQTLGWVITSETCAMQPPVMFTRHVQPGEIVEISRTDGIVSRREWHKRLPPNMPKSHPALCVFEYVYFARPDSKLEEHQVNTVRERCGEQLAVEAPAEVDLISNVPESATPAALGYARRLNKPYVQVLFKNSYVGRSFIQPSTALRQTAVHRKFGVFTEKVAGKNVVLVDDSIVRGNTMGPIVKLLKDNGAAQVHIRLASPPLMHPCYMGVNIPSSDELIAHRLRVKQPDGTYHPDLDALAKHIGAESVRYLSLDGLLRAVQDRDENDRSPSVNKGHCVACLNGDYPVIPKNLEW